MPKKTSRNVRAAGLKNFSFHVTAKHGAEVANDLRASFARMVTPAGAAADPLAALQSESGALNESYSDIFGVMIRNWADNRWQSTDRKAEWKWLIGQNLTQGGAPFRSMSDRSNDPALAPGDGQPKFYKDFAKLPVNRNNDMGGVHINSGIPNYCAFLILTRTTGDRQGFTADEYAQLFYVTLTARLNRTANFAANRAGLINSARSLFRNDPDGGTARVGVVTSACDTVGI